MEVQRSFEAVLYGTADILMRSFLSRLKRVVSRKRDPVSTLDYWNTRVRRFGRRSVLNLDHSDEEYEKVTRYQIDQIFPCLKECLRGDEAIVLDVGCGPGRFTPHLASLIGGRAIGIDPIEDLLRLAPTTEDVEYRLIEKGRFPVENEFVDVVWVCLVLGGLKGEELSETIGEIKRVLKPNGLLFLIENTSERESVPHWAYRSYEEYRAMFPFVRLRHHKDYMDLYERHTIMSGRKLKDKDPN